MKLTRRMRRHPEKFKLPFHGPQPTAQTYRVDRGGSFVVLSFSGDCGQWVVFLKPDDAESLASDVSEAAVEVRTGLTIARGNVDDAVKAAADAH